MGEVAVSRSHGWVLHRSSGASAGGGPEALDSVYLVLDPQLQPVQPDRACQESVRVFEQHKQLAREFLRVQTEIAYLSRYMGQLAERLSEEEGLSQLDQLDTERHQGELRKLEAEKEGLLALKRNLQRQLELLRGRRHSGPGPGPGSAAPGPAAPGPAPSGPPLGPAAERSGGGGGTGDGWVVVPV